MGRDFAGILLVVFILLGAVSAASALECTISDTGACTNPLFSMKQLENSHAELPGQGTYDFDVCCDDPTTTVGNSCSGETLGVDYDVVLNLFQQTNSHAQQNNYSDYSNQVCLSINPGIEVNCEYNTPAQGEGDCESLGGEYECVASLYKGTNSHVGVCSYYSIKVCCMVVGDVTPPEAGIIINDGDAATGEVGVSLKLTYGDPESGIAIPGCQYSDNGVDYEPLETCPSLSGTPPTGLRWWDLPGDDGEKTVYFKVFNKLLSGNNFIVVTDTIILDREEPASVTFDDYPEKPTTERTPSFQGNAIDLTSDITLIQYRVLNNSDLNQEVITWTDTVFQPSQNADYSFTASLPDDGDFRFEVRVQDQAGNQYSEQVFQDLVIDSTAPVTTDDADSEPHSSPYIVHLDCKDNVLGCKTTFWCERDNGGECTPDQEYGTEISLACDKGDLCEKYIKYYSTDSIGNQEVAHESVMITIDYKLPRCGMTALDEYTGGETLPYIPLEWDGEDPNALYNLKNFTLYYRQASGGSWTRWRDYLPSEKSDTFPASKEGLYEFQCKAGNDNGETGPASSTVRTTVDITIPFVSLDLLPEWFNLTSFIVSWEGSDAALDSFIVEYKVGEQGQFVLWDAYKPSTKTDIFGPEEPVKVAEGEMYIFKVSANDSAGNVNISRETNINIDITDPKCEMQPLPEWTSTREFDVEWSGSDDNSGVAYSGVEVYDLQVSYDRVDWSSIPVGSATSTPVAGVDGSTLYFRCRAQDFAGNLGDFSDTVSTTIDTAPPSLTVTLSPSSNVRMLEELTVSAEIEDIVEVTAASLEFEGSVITPESFSQIPWAWNLTWKLPGKNDTGTYSFKITVTDGNENSDSQEITFFVVECLDGDLKVCGSNVGECGEGNRSCVNNGWGPCTGHVGPTAEDCNGLDDNCDSQVDESLDAPSCPLTMGVCAGANQVCLGYQGWSCGSSEYGSLYEATESTCDSLDNDCDGQIDEGCACNAGDTIECGTTNTGVCSTGVQTCENSGTWGLCTGSIEPQPEDFCGNQKDDDCDGQIDEGCGTVLTGEFPWYTFMIAGVVVLIVLTLLILFLRSKGKSLTWEEVTRRWQ